MSSISPKAITKEQFLGAYKNGVSMFFKNIVAYMILWLPVLASMYLTFDIKYLIFLVIPISMISVIASFELTCTLYVDYKGSLLDKLKISFKAALKNLLNVFKSDLFWMSFLIVIFVLPVVSSFILKESKPQMILYITYFSVFAISNGYNIFNMLKMGIISMYVPDGDKALVENLYLKAFTANIKFAIITLLISFCFLILVSFVMWIFVIVASLSAAISFYLFIEIFEPPFLNQKQEESSDVKNAVPEAS